MAILLFLVGLAFLVIGAEMLVRGSSRLAVLFGVSPLVIGLTIVAFGTSSPELAVSVKSALTGQADISLGNVIGSNIFNVLFILGVSALIVPLVISQQLIRFDVPIMIVLSVLVLLLGLDGNFSRIEGLVFVAGLVLYCWFLVKQCRKESVEVKAEYNQEFGNKKAEQHPWMMNISMVIGGLVLLVLGSRWLVDSAITFARYLGVSELVVGLTIVAAGTSLPEVVTSIIAALRGERDIAVGNVVGSNIFNIMGVLGIAGMVAPSGIEVSPAIIRFDIPVMIAVALACLPIFYTGGSISRQEGALLLGYYIAYTVYLIMASVQHDALPSYSASMLYFVIPLTAVTLIIFTVRELRRKKLKV